MDGHTDGQRENSMPTKTMFAWGKKNAKEKGIDVDNRQTHVTERVFHILFSCYGLWSFYTCVYFS